ncbi:leucine-rich repeat domain-containing protein [Bifidobacterium criceti]|uniref:Leucine Rich repeats (2 copies) n=1 Tax=Bifidobacterium criceti TaxID=1960969 RepID=A0A2A2EIB3_9BIFI|nr:leucine-rich repeat domain-containing protein [Bifidobacterium criceti]PAU68638.1 Leucine Rich repeats (2 copies) [Bifidobacterium criceti]
MGFLHHVRRYIGAALACALLVPALPAYAEEGRAAASSCTIGTSTFTQCLPDGNLAAAVSSAAHADVNAVITQQSVDSVSSLHARNAQIKDLTGLQTFNKLTDVQLSNNSIESIDPLASMTQLRSLQLYNNRISDLTPLSKLTSLEKLGLGDNAISDITPVSSLGNLKSLNISHNTVDNIAAVRSLGNLEYLWAAGNKLSNIDAVNALTKLLGGDFSENQITSVANVTADPEQYLVLTGQLIESVVTVNRGDTVSVQMPIGYDGKHVAPSSVDNNGTYNADNGHISWKTTDQYSGMGFTAVFMSQGGGQSGDMPFSGVVRLRVVYNGEPDQYHVTDGMGARPSKKPQQITAAHQTTCTDGTSTIADCFPDAAFAKAIASALGASVTDVVSAQKLDTIEEISAPNAGITHISGAEHLTNLKSVFLSGNPISDLSPLSTLQKISNIQIYDAMISDVSALSDKPELWGLGLGNNYIADFGVIKNVPKLAWADIYSNLVNDVSFVTQWPRLDALWLSGNPFTDVSPIAKIPQLRRLQLETNSISDMSPLKDCTPSQYSMNDNQAIKMEDVTVEAGGSVTLQMPKGKAGGYLHPTELSDDTAVFDGKTGTVTWKNVKNKGTYYAYFSESDDMDYLYGGVVFRTVNVDFQDKTAPTFGPIYDTYATINEPFDPLMDVTASDDVDGDVTSRITVALNEIDIHTPGTYRVRYHVQDSAGNETWGGRRVTVTDATIKSIKTWPTYAELNKPVTPNEYAEATWTDGKVSTERAMWEKIDPAQFAKAGTFEVQGTVHGQKVTQKVIVQAKVQNVAVAGEAAIDGFLLLNAKSTAQLSAKITPEGATVAATKWTSADEKIAKVDAKGTVTAVAQGSTTITVDVDGKTASIPVKVRPRFTDVPTDTLFASDIDWLASVRITTGNTDGSYGYNGTLTRQDMAVFMYRLAKLRGDKSAVDFKPTAADYKRFKDVKQGQWPATEILWMASVGITKGNTDGTFGCNDKLTRRDMAIFLYRLAKHLGDTTTEGFTPTDADYKKFSDIRKGDFGAYEILWMSSNGITNGKYDGSYGCMDALSRKDMAVFLHRINEHIKHNHK